MSTHSTVRALPARHFRLPVAQLAGGLLVAGIVAVLTVVLVKLSAHKSIAVLVVVAGSVWCLATNRTPLALAVLMLYLGLLDGYVKLSTSSNVVTFVRDALLFSIALGVLVRATVQRRRLALPPLSVWVLGFVVLVLVQLANPGNGTLYHSLAGIRQHLEFVPLFFLTYTFVRSKRSLRNFVVLLALLAVANGVANIVQFNLSPGQFAAWGPGYAQRVLGLGSFDLSGRSFYDANGSTQTRPFGLMSDAGAGGLVDAFAIGAVVALASLPSRRRYLALAAGTSAIAVAGIVTSQGRAVIICAFVVGLTYALLTATSRRGAATVVGIAALGLVSYFAVTGIVNSTQSPVLRASSLSAAHLFQTANSARGKSLSKIPTYLVDYPLGAGLGVAGPATGTTGAPPQAGSLDAENEFSFATLETGIPGMVMIVGFTAALVLIGFRRCRREPDPETRVLLAAVIAPIAGLLVIYAGGAYTASTPGAPYLWAAGGIVAYWLISRPEQPRSMSPPAASS